MNFIKWFAVILPVSLASLLTPKKLCTNCKHYIADTKRCALFGETDLVTGEVDYDRACVTRIDDKKCGENATYFDENQYKVFTVPYYFFREYWALSPVFLLIITWVYLYSVQIFVDSVVLH